MRANRPAAALDFIHIYGRGDWTAARAELIATALELLIDKDAQPEEGERSILSGFDVRDLFEVLEQ